MTKKNCPPVVDFWAQAHFNYLTQTPRDAQEKYLTSVRARDFASIIHNVIQPLLRAIGTPEAHSQHTAFEEMRAKMQSAAKKQEVLKGIPFLHRSCQPIDRVEFKDGPARLQASLFGNECEGMCGV